jgi:hypothetical protein
MIQEIIERQRLVLPALRKLRNANLHLPLPLYLLADVLLQRIFGIASDLVPRLGVRTADGGWMKVGRTGSRSLPW